jgi:long-subunit acyl-CoA synthetase (AMP-forming)
MLSDAASVNGQCLMVDGSDLLRTLRVSRAKAIVVDHDVSGSPWNVLRHHVTLDNDRIVTTSPSLPDLKKVYVVRRVEGRGPGDLLATLESREAWFQNDDVTPDDTITVATASGSSGFSKLVVVPHSHFTDMLKHFAPHFADPTVLEVNMSPPGYRLLCLSKQSAGIHVQFIRLGTSRAHIQETRPNSLAQFCR